VEGVKITIVTNYPLFVVSLEVLNQNQANLNNQLEEETNLISPFYFLLLSEILRGIHMSSTTYHGGHHPKTGHHPKQSSIEKSLFFYSTSRPDYPGYYWVTLLV
jgi:hypothetical protein